MKDDKSILHHCLYFTANSLSRVITRMAEQEFMGTGLSPSHAFLIMLVNDSPGILQKELCETLNLAPSTVTRFIDTLCHRGLVTRQTQGKSTMVFPTDTGRALQKPIQTAWNNLHTRYARILGLKEGDELTARIGQASTQLNNAV